MIWIRPVPMHTKVLCPLALFCFMYLTLVNISDTHSSKVKSYKKLSPKIVNMWVKE